MSENIRIEKFFADKMWVITLFEGNRLGVDTWEQAVRSYWDEAKSKYGENKRLASSRYLVYDTTAIANLGFTNYLQQRASIMAREDGEATGRVALVMRIPPTILYFFDVFVRLTGSRMQPHLEVKFFSEREAAIEWVSASVPQEV
jgi:hypothetical protein